MKKSLATTAAILAATLALGVTACGSDDEGDGGGTSASEQGLSKEELIVQADSICKQGGQELNEISNNAFPANSEPSDEEVADFVSEKIIPQYESEVEELRGLQADAEYSEQWDEVLDTLESDLERLDSDPVAAVATDESPFKESSALAREFGLKVCGGN